MNKFYRINLLYPFCVNR